MNFAVWLIERPRWFKRTMLIANDFAMLGLALWAAYSLRLSRIYIPETWQTLVLLLAAPVIGVMVFYWRGLYKLVTRFIGPSGTTQIYIAVIIAAVLWALIVLMSGVKGQPRSVVVIYALIAAGLIRLSRQWAGAMLLKAAPQFEPARADSRKNVIIYGAGPAGIQLLRALNEAGTYRLVAFIDSSPSLARQVVHGVKVIRPEKIGKVIADEKVDEVLLATPSALRGERRLALKLLEKYPV
ncbi:MAG: polysaccharide biosynthesis protein, partial [Pseudomonadota bacterium]